MDFEKTGNFIAKLRKENNMSQQELADLIHVSREAVSKWELGKTKPNDDILNEICKIFKISFFELLYGEKKTNKNRKEIEKLSFNFYYNYKKSRKKIIFLGISLMIIILLFLTYYFFTTYNSVKVYYVGTNDSYISIDNGIMITTNNRIYFNIGTIETNKDIISSTLYYIDENKKKVFIMQGRKDLIFEDTLGYNEYIDLNNLNQIINNMYIEIEFEDELKDIKIDFNKSFSNNNLFIKSSKPSGIENENINKKDSETELEKVIKNKFKLENDSYNYKKDNINYIYFIDPKLLILSNKEENIIKEYKYYLKNDYLIYEEYKNNKTTNSFSVYEGNITCDIDKCYDEEKLIQTFYLYLENLLNESVT